MYFILEAINYYYYYFCVRFCITFVVILYHICVHICIVCLYLSHPFQQSFSSSPLRSVSPTNPPPRPPVIKVIRMIVIGTIKGNDVDDAFMK